MVHGKPVKSYRFILCETFHIVLESVVTRINPDITGQYLKSGGYMMGSV